MFFTHCFVFVNIIFTLSKRKISTLDHSLYFCLFLTFKVSLSGSERLNIKKPRLTIEKGGNWLPFIYEINFSPWFTLANVLLFISFYNLIGPLSGPVEKVEGKKAETDNREKRGFQDYILLRFLGQCWVWLRASNLVEFGFELQGRGHCWVLLLLPRLFCCYLLCWTTFNQCISQFILISSEGALEVIVDGWMDAHFGPWANPL